MGSNKEKTLQELLVINEKLSIKTIPENVEDVLQDWRQRASRDPNFLKLLLEELRKIGRQDLACELISSSTEGRRSYGTIDQTPEEMVNKRTLLEGEAKNYFEAEKTKKSCYWSCIALSTSCVIMILVMCITLGIASGVYFGAIGITAVGEQKETLLKVVAEDDTVSLVELNKLSVSSILISEVVNKGDNGHRVTLALVPTDKLTYTNKLETDSWNGSTIVDNLPIINEMYVYLNEGSELSYTISMGNGQHTDSATLFIFDQESEYKDYFSYNVLNNPVFSQKIPIALKDEQMMPTDVTFKASTNAYYFVVLIAPEENTEFSYEVKATERVVDIQQYTTNYPSCVIDTDRNCTLATNGSNSQNLTLLAYTAKTFDLSSKINHIQVILTKDDNSSPLYLMTMIIVLPPTALLLLTMLTTVSIVIFQKRRRSKRQYSYLAIN